MITNIESMEEDIKCIISGTDIEYGFINSRDSSIMWLESKKAGKGLQINMNSGSVVEKVKEFLREEKIMSLFDGDYIVNSRILGEYEEPIDFLKDDRYKNAHVGDVISPDNENYLEFYVEKIEEDRIYGYYIS